MRKFQKYKENNEGRDSNEPTSKNQWLKWNIIKYKDQNENTPQNIRSESVFLPKYFLSSLGLEIDIWLLQLQSYFLFLFFNFVCRWKFSLNPASTLDLSSHHIKWYQKKRS